MPALYRLGLEVVSNQDPLGNLLEGKAKSFLPLRVYSGAGTVFTMLWSCDAIKQAEAGS